MIGKGFVLFKINSSPSAFYIIKTNLHIVIGFKVSSYFKKLSKSTNPNICLRWLVMTSSLVRIQSIQLVYTLGWH